MAAWGTPAEQERRRRILVSVAAWAYEKHSTSLMSDADYDRLSYEIDPSVSTGNRKLDNFFKKHFQPDTGMWVNQHPERDKLEYQVRRRLGTL